MKKTVTALCTVETLICESLASTALYNGRHETFPERERARSTPPLPPSNSSPPYNSCPPLLPFLPPSSFFYLPNCIYAVKDNSTYRFPLLIVPTYLSGDAMYCFNNVLALSPIQSFAI